MPSSAVAAAEDGAFVGVMSGEGYRPAVGAPRMIAHRGASRYAPENTLAAVDAAHARKLLWVENDVQRTKDGATGRDARRDAGADHERRKAVPAPGALASG